MEDNKMSDLTNLVPPLELCKLIPAGEFEDAAFAWVLSDVVGFTCRTSGCEQFSGQEWQVIRSNASRIRRARKRGEEIYPAPTLVEIMKELPASNIYRIKQTWTANFINDSVDNGIKSRSATTAALKLWLKLKGIENGE
jgi:hypothetical protein